MNGTPDGFPNFRTPKEPKNKTEAQKRGAANRRFGLRKQREARKALEKITGREANRFIGALGNEESWSGLSVRVEVKSGDQVAAIWRKYEHAETQSEQSRAIGDNRPFVFIAAPRGSSEQLFICRLSKLQTVLENLRKGGE